jgi:amino acid transporter
MWTGAAIGVTFGAAITGLVALIANHGSHAVSRAVIVAWAILAIAGLGTALVRRYLSLRRERYDARVGVGREPRADHYR